MLSTIVQTLALVSLGLSSLLLIRIRSRLALVLWLPKMLAGGLSGLLVGTGVLGAALGLWLGRPCAAGAALASAGLAAYCVWRIGVPTPVVDRAFACADSALPRPRLQRRFPALRPRWERDVPFWDVPGSGPLLCDLWRPPVGVQSTGIAVVYLHSSTWHLADKDLWTRPLFRYLASQGHVVMDVAYRLCPEVSVLEMLGDAKRAIAWMKANAGRYDVCPERVIPMGASAGGHLALLAAYTSGQVALTPDDLLGVDTSVRAVISCYGVTDLRACYRHVEALLPGPETCRRLAGSHLPGIIDRAARALGVRPFAGQMWKLGPMCSPGVMANLLGGSPKEVGALYDLASPLNHAGPHCPPTLLLHGEHDTAVPAAGTRALERRLAASGVPVACVMLPHTDHVFDLVLPQISPAARAARGVVGRFLDLMA